jgi:class 3 adenylate cyclase
MSDMGLPGRAGPSTAIVLFTDVVGSTELRVRVGEDAAEEARRVHDRLVGGAIEANHGRVVKSLGDGVMAVFTGAAEAVTAAVAIQRVLDRHSLGVPQSSRFEVRIGLSAGDVTPENGDCFGTPVVEAARLCAAARGRQILATEVVRLLVGQRWGHLFRAVGSLQLRGLADPVATVEVDWAPEAGIGVPLPAALERPGPFRFVGREAEWARLGRAWKEVAGGARRVALIAGEPGIGKTRLVAELARKVQGEGAVVLYGSCDEELGLAYQALADGLRTYVGSCPAEELRVQLGPLGGELARLVPGLRERVSGLAEPLRSEPETERYRLLEAVGEFLAEVCAAAPVLLVVDDLHWAAKPTLVLLRHLIRRGDLRRLLVVGTYRHTELSRAHSAGRGSGRPPSGARGRASGSRRPR